MRKTTLLHLSLLSWFVFACGDGRIGVVADAGDSDGNTNADAGGADAMPPSSTCGLRFIPPAAMPAMGFEVVFSNPDGSVIGTATTDTNGLATRDDCVADTMLTIAVPGVFANIEFTTVTYTNIASDGMVVFGQPGAAPADVTDLDVTLAGAQGGATQYKVTAGCTLNAPVTFFDGAPNALSTLDISAACVGETATDVGVLAIALDAGNALVGFDFAVGVAITGATTDAGTLDGWEAPVTLDYDISNVPGNVNGYLLNIAFYNDGIRYYSARATNVAIAGGAIDTTAAGISSAFADQVSFSGVFGFDSGGIASFGRWSAPQAGFTADFASTLPEITSLTVDTAVATRPSMAWVASGSLAAADYGALFLSWVDTDGDDHDAFFIVPGNAAGPVQMPELPSTLDDFRPAASDTVDRDDATFVQLDGRTYDELLSSGALNPRQAGAGATGVSLQPGVDGALTSTTGN